MPIGMAKIDFLMYKKNLQRFVKIETKQQIVFKVVTYLIFNLQYSLMNLETKNILYNLLIW